MDEQLLFPERKRCGICRSYFGPGVIDGLYCSRECAGLPPQAIAPVPDGDPGDLPRCCRTKFRPSRANPVRAKVRYQSRHDADATIGHGRTSQMNVYQCEHCGYWHTGHRIQRI